MPSLLGNQEIMLSPTKCRYSLLYRYKLYNDPKHMRDVFTIPLFLFFLFDFLSLRYLGIILRLSYETEYTFRSG
jgi:hypothetical protein